MDSDISSEGFQYKILHKAWRYRFVSTQRGLTLWPDIGLVVDLCQPKRPRGPKNDCLVFHNAKYSNATIERVTFGTLLKVAWQRNKYVAVDFRILTDALLWLDAFLTPSFDRKPTVKDENHHDTSRTEI